MSLFYVSQNKTYKQESKGEYLWSPQKAKDGKNNKGYINMSKVKAGDIIFHGANQSTYAISIAVKNCYAAVQPSEINNLNWNKDGYRVDSDYILLGTKLNMKPLLEWFKVNYKEGSAFDVNGECKQVYLSNIDIVHAKYLIHHILKLPLEKDVRSRVKCILKDIVDEKISEYDDSELDTINDIVEGIQPGAAVPTWNGQKEEKEFTNAPGTVKPKPKRSAKKAANALAIADHSCEYDKTDRVFARKNGVGYTEPHHLILISKHEDFDYSLDVEENIVSLCSHCHNLLHYGRQEDKKTILIKLLNDRKDALLKAGLATDIAGLEIDLDRLMEYYK